MSNMQSTETDSSSKLNELERLSRLVRSYIVRATTAAGSGHVTSSFSATELAVALYFHRLRFDLENPLYPNNDRVLFSKGHASPLFYSLYVAAGAVPEDELDRLRTLGSPFEGHPTPNFRYAEAATGSLGQGLSIGVGLALNAKYLDRLPYMTWVLLGDGEMAEGSVWEAAESAAFKNLGNLVALVDINRLGQSGPTMRQHDMSSYQVRFESFGWKTLVVDGHDLASLVTAYDSIDGLQDRPTVILAKTYKGRGVSFLEDKEGWHGKALSEEQALRALEEIGPVEDRRHGEIRLPERVDPAPPEENPLESFSYEKGAMIATRRAYGDALVRVGRSNGRVVGLDGDVKNSSFAEGFSKEFPHRYFEMFIAEQNMVGTAVGLGTRGKIPFVSTFAAFLTRAADQIRMAVYSRANIKIVGSHAGSSIGEDGPSQMGLEDIAQFRALGDSIVLVPCDAVSTQRLVEQMTAHRGIAYLRTSRPATPVLYDNDELFPIGGSKVVRDADSNKALLIGVGISVHIAIKAAEKLESRGISVAVLDAYSVKPLDIDGISNAARKCEGRIVTVEDAWPQGGLGEAVAGAFSERADIRVRRIAVDIIPGSGPSEDVLQQVGLTAENVSAQVESFLGGV